MVALYKGKAPSGLGSSFLLPRGRVLLSQENSTRMKDPLSRRRGKEHTAVRSNVINNRQLKYLIAVWYRKIRAARREHAHAVVFLRNDGGAI